MRPHRALAAAELHAEPVGYMHRGIGEHGIVPERERDVEGDDIAQQRTRGILRPDLLSDRGVLVGEEATDEPVDGFAGLELGPDLLGQALDLRAEIGRSARRRKEALRQPTPWP